MEAFIKQITRSGQSAAILVKQYPDCPFGIRRFNQVRLILSAFILSIILFILSFLIFGIYSIFVFATLIFLFFVILGILNAFYEKDIQCLFIPPLTFMLIVFFSFHFLDWYIRKNKTKSDLMKYLQIN